MARRSNSFADERALLAAHRHGAGRRVDREAVELERRLLRLGRRALARRSTARTRLTSSCGAEGLDHVVVGAHLEPRDALGLRLARGQHDERRVAARPQPARDLVAVDLGQHEVEHDEVGRRLAPASRGPPLRRRRRAPRSRRGAGRAPRPRRCWVRPRRPRRRASRPRPPVDGCLLHLLCTPATRGGRARGGPTGERSGFRKERASGAKDPAGRLPPLPEGGPYRASPVAAHRPSSLSA